MKKGKIFLRILLLYFIVFWKMPFYIGLLCIELPEDAIVLKRQVTLTDVYYWHILAEMVFVSDQGYDNVKEIMLAENRIIMRENVFMDWHIMSRAGVEEWDNCCVSVKEMDELSARIEDQKLNWYYVSIGMTVEVFIFLSIAVILAIFIVMHIVLGHKKKKER